MRNYTLFRRGLEVVGYAECHPDVRTVRGRVEASDVNKRWQAWFADIIETPSNGEWKAEYHEVWHID
jgi:L-rhamnose mutarotase